MRGQSWRREYRSWDLPKEKIRGPDVPAMSAKATAPTSAEGAQLAQSARGWEKKRNLNFGG